MRSWLGPLGDARLLVAATALATVASPRPARAQIFQPGSQPVGRDGGIENEIQTSSGCARCHSSYDDAAGADYEPFDTWRGTMMANAARDPIFRAALAIAEVDNASAADFCVRCHSPVAWLRGRSELASWSEMDGPRFVPDDPTFQSHDLDGVACMVCHRATDSVPSDPMAPYLGNAQIYYVDGAMFDTRFGPYEYAAGEEPMHPTAPSTFMPRGEFCGQCHDISNPVVMGRRADGSATGRPFAIERTFSEWSHSAFPARGETCQSCHMPDVETDVRAAGDGVPRAYMRRHDLAGGSSWVPRAIVATLPGDDPERAEMYAAASQRAEATLGRAAMLELRDVHVDGSDVVATVRVTNLTGHKLPTGYPEGRRMWLEVAVMDGAGNVVNGSGLYDDATSTLMRDAQLRTYEIKLGQGATEGFHFILNDTVVEDTRIPPEGFDADDSLDMSPVGRDYADGAGGTRHWDEATFRFPACGTGSLMLRARLRYQSTTREYIEFLRDTAPDDPDPTDAIDNWGRTAYELWTMYGGGTPTNMAETSMAFEGTASMCPDAGPPVPDSGTAGGADAGTPPGTAEGSCGCRIAGATGSRDTHVPALAVVLAIAAAGLTARRRRRAR